MEKHCLFIISRASRVSPINLQLASLLVLCWLPSPSACSWNANISLSTLHLLFLLCAQSWGDLINTNDSVAHVLKAPSSTLSAGLPYMNKISGEPFGHLPGTSNTGCTMLNSSSSSPASSSSFPTLLVSLRERQQWHLPRAKLRCPIFHGYLEVFKSWGLYSNKGLMPLAQKQVLYNRTYLAMDS